MNILKSSLYLISSFSFLSSFLYVATPVQAENQIQNRIEERREIRQENQEDKQEIREENRQNRQELRVTVTQDKFALRRQNAVKIANNMVAKLKNRFEYLNKIKTRLQTRITSLESSRNMSEAKLKLASYDTTKYTNHLAALNPIIASISTADKPNSVIPTLREAAKLVQDDLKDLHQVLVDSLKLMVKSPKISP